MTTRKHHKEDGKDERRKKLVKVGSQSTPLSCTWQNRYVDAAADFIRLGTRTTAESCTESGGVEDIRGQNVNGITYVKIGLSSLNS